MAKICSIAGCKNLSRCRDMCGKHYQAWRKNGGIYEGLQVPGKASNVSGYLYVSGRPLHIQAAEKALGKSLPLGAIVHHVDEDKGNNSNDNLVICPNVSYHRIIHRRTDAYNACGNATHCKCVVCKQYDDPANMHVHQQSEHNGTSYVHKKCRAEYDKVKYLNKVGKEPV